MHLDRLRDNTCAGIQRPSLDAGAGGSRRQRNLESVGLQLTVDRVTLHHPKETHGTIFNPWRLLGAIALLKAMLLQESHAGENLKAFTSALTGKFRRRVLQ